MPNARIYHPCGAAGLPIRVNKFAGVGSHSSALTVVRFNQGSKHAVEALVGYIYMTLGPNHLIYTPSLACLSLSHLLLAVPLLLPKF